MSIYERFTRPGLDTPMSCAGSIAVAVRSSTQRLTTAWGTAGRSAGVTRPDASVSATSPSATAKGEKRKAARDQGMHALRHTAASAWLSAGADIVAVAAWLGDTVETVYKAYAHLMPDADERGRKAMDQFFRRPGREGSALDVPSDGTQ